MNFWTGFACGVAATYALSIGAIVAVVLLWRRAERREAAHAERLLYVIGYDPSSAESLCLEDPTVYFTHVTEIGHYVRGRDD